MRSNAHGRLLRWLLLCALAFGVVGMHHLATADGMPGLPMPAMSAPAAMDMPHAATTPPNDEHQPTGPTPAHDLMHLCMAVLCAIEMALLLGWLLLRAVGVTALLGLAARVLAPWARGHPPPTGGRLLLASVCVLRL